MLNMYCKTNLNLEKEGSYLSYSCAACEQNRLLDLK